MKAAFIFILIWTYYVMVLNYVLVPLAEKFVKVMVNSKQIADGVLPVILLSESLRVLELIGLKRAVALTCDRNW